MPAISAPIIDIETDFYLVDGSTAKEIRYSLDMNTPVHVNGVKYDASTHWSVKWHFWWHETGESCTLTDKKIRIEIRYILPKLDDPLALSAHLKKKWETYFITLRQHEDGHKNLGIKAANEIEQSLADLAPRDTCKQLENDANQLAHKIIEKYSRLEKEYDRKTNHGMNVGALFP